MGYYIGAGDNLYGAGDYYVGDYYRGDPGIFGAIGRIGGAIIKRVGTKILGATPIGAAAKELLPVFSGGSRSTPGFLQSQGIPVVPSPGIGGAISRILPGGETGYEVRLPMRKRRRMNVANVKALRRAIRRAMGFEKLARRVGHFTRPGQAYRLKVRKRASRGVRK